LKSKDTKPDNRDRREHDITRRDMLTGLAGSVAAAAIPFQAQSNRAAADEAHAATYDLLIKGGKVIDPSQGIEGVRDVAIKGSKVALVDQNIAPSSARQVLKADGHIVTPGLVDLHVHVFPYCGYGVEPDRYCVARGVTTAVDAGTAGISNIDAFRHFVIDRAATRIRVLLNISALGIMAAGEPLHIGELEDLRYCDPKLAVKACVENKDLILGLKVRLSTTQTGPGSNDMKAMRIARQAADEAGVPLMVHIGASNSPLKDYLPLMKAGDIATHIYNPKSNTVLDASGTLLPEVVEARKRGILFDLGPGKPSFSFANAEKCLAQGFLVDTISSDTNSLTMSEEPPNDLPTAASKMLLLGVSLSEVVALTTVNAARALKFRMQIGTLKPGAEADVSVLDLRDGDYSFIDGENKTRKARQMLFPIATVRGGKVFHPQARAQGT
jgi:dihydroorotase